MFVGAHIPSVISEGPWERRQNITLLSGQANLNTTYPTTEGTGYSVIYHVLFYHLTTNTS